MIDLGNRIAPHAYAVAALGQKPYLWQAKIMFDVVRGYKTAARCCNA